MKTHQPKYVYELFHWMTERIVCSHKRRVRLQIKLDHYQYQWSMVSPPRECPMLIRKVELFGPWPNGGDS